MAHICEWSTPPRIEERGWCDLVGAIACPRRLGSTHGKTVQADSCEEGLRQTRCRTIVEAVIDQLLVTVSSRQSRPRERLGTIAYGRVTSLRQTLVCGGPWETAAVSTLNLRLGFLIESRAKVCRQALQLELDFDNDIFNVGFIRPCSSPPNHTTGDFPVTVSYTQAMYDKSLVQESLNQWCRTPTTPRASGLKAISRPAVGEWYACT